MGTLERGSRARRINDNGVPLYCKRKQFQITKYLLKLLLKYCKMSHKMLGYNLDPSNLPAIQAHYNAIAREYDHLYRYIYEFVAAAALKHLSLSPDDRLAEIGGGTGEVAHLLWKMAGLKNPALVVDPTPSMLEIARTKEGIETMLATADDFVTSPILSNYNKVLIGRCFNHLHDPATIFNSMRENCQAGTLCLVLHDIEMPVLCYANKVASRGLPREVILSPLEKAGWAVENHIEVFAVKMTKGEWYGRLRGKSYSSLEVFTDEEIEAGISELDKTQMSGIALDENIDLREEYLCVKLTVPQ